MEENEILKPIYLSKKDIINNIPYLYTEKEDNTYYITKNLKNYSIPKKQKNLGRKNLTYQNFLDFTYDFNNITEHKLKMPDHLKIKQKYELMFNKGYSPFQPKKARKKIAPLLITGLNTTNNGKYSNIFSSSQKTFENSDIKTKSSSHKFHDLNAHFLTVSLYKVLSLNAMVKNLWNFSSVFFNSSGSIDEPRRAHIFHSKAYSKTLSTSF